MATQPSELRHSYHQSVPPRGTFSRMRQEWMRDQLKKQGKKSADLARHLDLPRSRISEIINGKREIQSREVRLIAEFFGISNEIVLALSEGHSVSPDDDALPPPTPISETPDEPPLYTGSLEPGFIPLDDTDYASIARFDARASAGAGSLLSADPEPLGYHLVEAQWLRAITATAPKHLVIVMIDGDSMEPTLSDRDWVLVDTTECRPGAQAIYALRFNDKIWVKRLQPSYSRGMIRILSDNPKYEPDEMPDAPESDTEVGLQIIGRVIAIVARKL